MQMSEKSQSNFRWLYSSIAPVFPKNLSGFSKAVSWSSDPPCYKSEYLLKRPCEEAFTLHGETRAYLSIPTIVRHLNEAILEPPDQPNYH